MRAEVAGGIFVTSAEYAVTLVDEVFPLSIDISTSPDPVAADGRLLYDITVSNTSSVPVNGVNVLLRVPPELRFYFTTDVEPNAAGCSLSITHKLCTLRENPTPRNII